MVGQVGKCLPIKSSVLTFLSNDLAAFLGTCHLQRRDWVLIVAQARTADVSEKQTAPSNTDWSARQRG
jgi:hypothetical protein